MGTPQGESEGRSELDDSGCVEDDSPPAKKPKPEMAESYERCISLLDLSDDVLLNIFQHLSACDLKALGFSCIRLSVVIRDRTLWGRVDARDRPAGRTRLPWIMGNLHEGTTELMIAGYAREAAGCLGHMSADTKKEDEEKKDAGAPETPEPPEEPFGDDIENPAAVILEVPRGGEAVAGAPFALLRHQGRLHGHEQQLPRFSGAPTWTEDCLDAIEIAEGDGKCCGPQFSFTRRMLADLALMCPRLTSLSMDYCNINCKKTNLSHLPPTVTRLSLRGSRCYNLTLDRSFLFKIQDFLPNLAYLDVSECVWMEPANLLPLSKLKVLTHLLMQECPRLSEFVAYVSLATRYGFKRLKFLDLRGSPVGDSEVSALGWLSELEELYVCPPTHPPEPEPHSHCLGDVPALKEILEPWELEDVGYDDSWDLSADCNMEENVEPEETQGNGTRIDYDPFGENDEAQSIQVILRSHRGDIQYRDASSGPDRAMPLPCPNRALPCTNRVLPGPFRPMPCTNRALPGPYRPPPVANKATNVTKRKTEDGSGPSDVNQPGPSVKRKRPIGRKIEACGRKIGTIRKLEVGGDRVEAGGRVEEGGRVETNPPVSVAGRKGKIGKKGEVGKKTKVSTDAKDKPVTSENSETCDKPGTSDEKPGTSHGNSGTSNAPGPSNLKPISDGTPCADDATPGTSSERSEPSNVPESGEPMPGSSEPTPASSEPTPGTSDGRYGSSDEPGPSDGTENNDNEIIHDLSCKKRKSPSPEPLPEASKKKRITQISVFSTSTEVVKLDMENIRNHLIDDRVSASRTIRLPGPDPQSTPITLTFRDIRGRPIVAPPRANVRAVDDNSDANNEGDDNSKANDEGNSEAKNETEGENSKAQNEGANNSKAQNEAADNAKAQNETEDDNSKANNETVDNSKANNESVDNSKANNESAENTTVNNDTAGGNSKAQNEGTNNSEANSEMDTENSKVQIETAGEKSKANNECDNDFKINTAGADNSRAKNETEGESSKTENKGADNSKTNNEDTDKSKVNNESAGNSKANDEAPDKSKVNNEGADNSKANKESADKSKANNETEGANSKAHNEDPGKSKGNIAHAANSKATSGETSKAQNETEKATNKKGGNNANAQNPPNNEAGPSNANNAQPANDAPELHYVRFRQNQDPVVIQCPAVERPEELHQEAEPRHHILYVNVGQQLHAVYRLLPTRPFFQSVRNRQSNIQNIIYTPDVHVDPSQVVSDISIRRFGIADGDNVNYINLGRDMAGHRDFPIRPMRSNLRVLSMTGYRNITNSSLVHLSTSAPHLRLLDFTQTGVTDEGVENFKSMRPDCEVRHSKFEDKSGSTK